MTAPSTPDPRTVRTATITGLVMVGRALGRRTTALTTGMVVVGGLLGAGVLAVL